MASSTRVRDNQATRLSQDDVMTLRSAAALLRKDASLDHIHALDLLGVRERRKQIRLARELAAIVGKAPRAEPRRRTAAARPLLASVPKKVGPLSAKAATKVAEPVLGVPAVKAIAAAKPSAAVPAAPRTAKASRRNVAALPADPMVLARMWTSLGLQMTFTAMTINARIARSMLDTPVATAALRQSSSMLRAFSSYGDPFAAFRGHLGRTC